MVFLPFSICSHWHRPSVNRQSPCIPGKRRFRRCAILFVRRPRRCATEVVGYLWHTRPGLLCVKSFRGVGRIYELPPPKLLPRGSHPCKSRCPWTARFLSPGQMHSRTPTDATNLPNHSYLFSSYSVLRPVNTFFQGLPLPAVSRLTSQEAVGFRLQTSCNSSPLRSRRFRKGDPDR